MVKGVCDLAFFALAIASVSVTRSARAQTRGAGIPLTRGLTIVETLSFPDGDRESVTTVADASAAGVRYAWRYIEVHANGDTVRAEYTRFVNAADLAGAPRLHTVWEPGAGDNEHPGYTALTLSTAVYRQLTAEGSAPYSIMTSEPLAGPGRALAALGGLPGGGAQGVWTRYRGTLARASAGPEPFPLLVSGRRVRVPALHLRGQFTARGRGWEPDIWVFADRAHPLLLKIAPTPGGGALQTVRVDLPERMPGSDERGGADEIEAALATTCRVELPGIYFDFNSANLDPTSDRTIASLARMLARHPAWTVTIEGHTDSIGIAAANQALSERRAEAVRNRLVTSGVDAARLRTAGYGALRPRESNATIEGRARNRRVELTRDCGGRGKGFPSNVKEKPR